MLTSSRQIEFRNFRFSQNILKTKNATFLLLISFYRENKCIALCLFSRLAISKIPMYAFEFKAPCTFRLKNDDCNFDSLQSALATEQDGKIYIYISNIDKKQQL